MIYTATLNPSLDRTLHFQRVLPGIVNRACRSRTDLSGKGINVSLALGRLGIPSVITGFIAGNTGRVLAQSLKRLGYECDFVEIDGETRSNITVIEEATQTTTKLNEAGPRVSALDIQRLKQRLVSRLKPDDMVIFSGSLPPGAPTELYALLIEEVHRQGAFAILDTSGPALRAGCRAQPDFIKPNALEASELTGIQLDPRNTGQVEQVLEALQTRNCGILLTLGKEGAICALDGQRWQAKPPAITEISNVGAGDAALAGAIYAWHHDLGPAEMAHWAVAVGAAKAATDGTAMPDRSRIQALYALVQVYPL